MEEFQQAGWANSSFKADNSGRQIVLFHTVQKKMEHKSTLQGRPVFEERTHITIISPGDQYTKIDRPVRELDKEVYAQQWAHWENTRQNKVIGTPIEHWHAITDTQKAEFKAMNIQTVEQFANLPDSVGQKVMGFNALRAKAQVFIESGKDAELLGKVRLEAEARQAELEKKIADLTAMVENLTAPSAHKKAG